MGNEEPISSVDGFAETLQKHGLSLHRDVTETLQVNVGKVCNLACRHCHHEAGPECSEIMDRETMSQVISYARRAGFKSIDITGGAPELVPDIGYLVSSLSPLAPRLLFRTNLTAMYDHCRNWLPQLLKSHHVAVVASLPSLNAEQTVAQRGTGTLEKSLEMLRFLNGLGFGQETARRLIPPGLASRFLFHGEQPQSALAGFFARARFAVVPSRWENFPNTCVEAMGSGLPVLATRQGGMAEMIVDGESGWLVDRPDPDALAAALERALDSPPAQLEAMGTRAAEAIGRLCADEAVTRAHREFREQVVHQAPRRSIRIPAGRVEHPDLSEAGRGGLAVILRHHGPANQLEPCLRRLQEQTIPPRFVATLDATEDPANAASEAARNAGARPLGFLFLEESPLPEPGLIEACLRTLERCPEVGIVSSWRAGPDPAVLLELRSRDGGTTPVRRRAGRDGRERSARRSGRESLPSAPARAGAAPRRLATARPTRPVGRVRAASRSTASG